jgi:RNA polymerase sigma factor (sigma-70 family)
MKPTEPSELLTAYQTRKSLLLRLKELGDDETWREFYGIYGRMIFGYALRFRLSHSEAEDVVQDVCVKLFRQIMAFDYSPDQGRFRGWLKTVTKHAVIDYIRRKERRSGHLENYRVHAEVLHEEKATAENSVWKTEWEKAVLDAALQRVYRKVGQQSQRVFHLFAVENMPANEVGERLGIEANAVYACKHRILKLVREEVEVLKDEL